MTLEATLLRHGRLLATQTKRSLIGGCAKSCTSLSRLAAPSLTSNTSTSGSLRFNSGGGVAGTLPTPQYAHKSTHRRSIHSSNLTNLAIASPSQPNLRTLTPNVRDAILSELQQVDIDQNGIINATELKILLSKHATAFTDDEVVELTELFYASTGGHGVEVMRFLEALDAAIAEKSTSGGGEMSEGERSPLVEGGKFKTHPLGIGTCASEYMFSKTHGKYTPEQLEIELTHLPPVTNMDKGALFAVKCFRFGFDQATGWNRGVMTPEKILNRAIFLETVAAIPGMVAAIIRHFRSLRNMTRDGGMLNMFLEEANNERMHLLTFIRLKDPGMIFRAAVIGAQGVFATGFGLAYVASPAFCHRFVGYIEEEACLTYTKIIKAIEEAEEGSELAQWKTQDAPKIAKGYWHLGDNGTVLDVMKAVRADEAEHRDVNHAVSGVPDDTVNPLYDPRERLDSMLTKYVKDIMEREQQVISVSTSLLDSRILGFTTHSDSFVAKRQSNGAATGRFFQVIGNIHDIESYYGIHGSSVNLQIFLSHFGHLAIIFLWAAGNLFHIGWNGNYELWIKNPVSTMPIAHGIWDPHFGASVEQAWGATSASGASEAVVVSYSGIYNWLYAVGFTSNYEIYNFVIVLELLAVAALLLGKTHLIYNEEFLQWLGTNKPYYRVGSDDAEVVSLYKKLSLDKKVYPMFTWPFRIFLAIFDASGLRLNFHIGALIGFTSLAWAGHLIHVAIPASRGQFHSISPVGDATFIEPSISELMPFFSGNWAYYATDIDKDNHIFGSTVGAGKALLTFLGGTKADTASLYLTDIAHHHLAIGVLFIWAGHVYQSLYKGMGHRIRDVLVTANSGMMIRSMNSYHLQLALACAGLGVLTSVVGQHIYSLAPYPYLAYDYVTTVALYLHHSWIASLLMMAAFAHAGIFLVRDYTINPASASGEDIIGRVLAHKAAIISHLSWVSLWLGFHTLGVYIHNDTVSAFGEPQNQILIEPIFAQLIQASSGKSMYGYGLFDVVNPSSGWVQTVNKSAGSLLLPIGPGDMLAHHAIALGLHITVLILIKGALDARGSKLMPDKIHFGYGFACDGPGRGGTCDISAWDSFYLAMFWMLNTNAWTIFYFHWKELTIWQNITFQFDESSTYLNGWFRDYLWFNSGSLIRGYDALGANDLSVWAWIFLAAHLCWATGFMFLISWRGYWQELIDIILYMHLKTPILYDLWNGGIYTPVALSIVQARFIGLVHFAVGFIVTYAAFIVGATT